MTRANRTVLMALFGPKFIISEDYNDTPLSWSRFQNKVQLTWEYHIQLTHQDHWGDWEDTKSTGNVIQMF